LANQANRIGFSWGLRKVTHPSGLGSILVPRSLVPNQISTQRGYAFEAWDQSISVDFSLIDGSEYGFIELFKRLSTDGKNRKVDYKIIHDNAFVVNGVASGKRFYSRYLNLVDKRLGFTVSWSEHFAEGSALAAYMANSLFEEAHSISTSMLPSPTAPLAPSQPPPPPATIEPSLPPTSEQVIYSGSGFFIASNGIGLTNHHVVEGCSVVTITGYGPATVVATDNRNDLALLRLTDQASTSSVSFRQKTAQLGEQTFVLGFPLAGTLDNGLNFTIGSVSSLAGIGGDSTRLQFTAPIQPGNSGGPIVDSQGRLIGITVAKLKDLAMLRESGQLPQNVNFGIKSEVALGFLALNGVEVSSQPDATALQATEIAKSGRAFAFQVFCQPGKQ
jgi:serine protease Do